jgi:hypothetical protein
MGLLIFLIGAALNAFVIHEGGHYATALCFGARIKFQLLWKRLWKISIPRGVWAMPDIARWKQCIIALAGFGTELLAVPVLFIFAPGFAVWYSVVAVAHFWAYPFYAGEDSDFRWVI